MSSDSWRASWWASGWSFGGALSPADLHIRAATAWEHHDYPEALRLWSQAVSLQPGNAELHYLRGRALAALGLRASAADAFQVTLLLEPQSTIAREAMDGLAGLPLTSAGDGEVLVPLESGLGVWIVPALVNGHRGRFLLDTGSSVIVVGPTLAAAAGLKAAAGREAITVDADRRQLGLRALDRYGATTLYSSMR